MSPRLVDRLGLGGRELVAIVGAGGKSTIVIRPTSLSAEEVQSLIEGLKEEGSSGSGSSNRRNTRRR